MIFFTCKVRTFWGSEERAACPHVCERPCYGRTRVNVCVCISQLITSVVINRTEMRRRRMITVIPDCLSSFCDKVV